MTTHTDPNIPEWWKETTLGEVVTKVNDRIDVSYLNLSNYISTENMISDKWWIGNAANLPTIWKVPKFKKWDILFSNIRTYFKKLWFSEIEWWSSNDVLIFRWIEQIIDKKFFFFNLSQENFFEHTVKTSKWTKMPRWDKDAISKFKILLPPLPEQRAIADMLSSFDKKIELLRVQNETIESTAQAIFYEWFGNYSVGSPEELPEGWKVGKLGDIVEIKNGFAFKSEDYVQEWIPIVRTTNFTNNSIVLDSVVYLTVEKAKEFDGWKLNKFDFLLVMVGASVGKSVITPSNVLPALQNQNMWNFKTIDESHKFFNILYIEQIIKNQINSVSWSARDFFRKDHFYNIDIFIPENNLLFDFNNILLPMFEKIDENITQIQVLSRTRDELLPRLMSGEVRVV